MRVFYFLTMLVMVGLVSFASRYTIADWQYWVTIAPASVWIGWTASAASEAHR
jgi:hypothetical protein